VIATQRAQPISDIEQTPCVFAANPSERAPEYLPMSDREV
jgi:hypothetical protein